MEPGRAGPAAGTLQESSTPSHTCMWPDEFAFWLDSPSGAGAIIGLTSLLGAMVGSFLNVVAHRVPRGETVIHGRSHCPACNATIRARDNVPVLGWLLLRGRCRDCGAAIPARYPLVEAGCGLLAGVIAAAELGGGDDALATWCGHAAVAFVVVAWSLLADRGHAVSRTTVAITTALAAVAAATVPALAPLPVGCACAPPDTTVGCTGCLLASLAGAVVGWLAPTPGGRSTRAACCLVGAALGWQAACLAAVAACVGRSTGRREAAGSLASLSAVVGWHPLAWAWEAACRWGCG